jgi:hypothetical protein
MQQHKADIQRCGQRAGAASFMLLHSSSCMLPLSCAAGRRFCHGCMACASCSPFLQQQAAVRAGHAVGLTVAAGSRNPVHESLQAIHHAGGLRLRSWLASASALNPPCAGAHPRLVSCTRCHLQHLRLARELHAACARAPQIYVLHMPCDAGGQGRACSLCWGLSHCRNVTESVSCTPADGQGGATGCSLCWGHPTAN